MMPDGQDAIKVSVSPSINDIDQEQWDACVDSDNPFASHAFLSALENSGSATLDTGWLPQHLTVENDQGKIVAAAPMYLKNHSYGEYVFDWGWADAYARAGGEYYPKLQCSIPFTPATGRRFLLAPNQSEKSKHHLESVLASAMMQLAEHSGASSVHITFQTQSECEGLTDTGFLSRHGHQFHWHNHGYQTFDDFLGGLSSRKRKQIKKERREVNALDCQFSVLSGTDITEAHWDAFYRFYKNTTSRKWGESYLTRDFFSLLGEKMGEKVVLIWVEDDFKPVAAALNIAGSDTLFGRNWGCDADHKFLHFETCYYAAIDYAITNGFSRVEAGAQGQHKLQRGYMPSRTYSSHWIADKALREPVRRFVESEAMGIAEDIAWLETKSPFKKSE